MKPPERAEAPTPANTLTVLDWLGVIIAALAVLALAVVPPLAAPAFRGMLEDFGGVLPALTALALTPGIGPALASVPLTLLVVGAGPWLGGRLALRRGLVVAAFIAALLGLALWLVALYLPVFELADAVRE